jgi:hypothetical protein
LLQKEKPTAELLSAVGFLNLNSNFRVFLSHAALLAKRCRPATHAGEHSTHLAKTEIHASSGIPGSRHVVNNNKLIPTIEKTD